MSSRFSVARLAFSAGATFNREARSRKAPLSLSRVLVRDVQDETLRLFVCKMANSSLLKHSELTMKAVWASPLDVAHAPDDRAPNSRLQNPLSRTLRPRLLCRSQQNLVANGHRGAPRGPENTCSRAICCLASSKSRRPSLFRARIGA